jgi:integrase
MASIDPRKGNDGKTRYRVRVRRQGLPALTKTFSRLTDAKAWASDIESSINKGEHVDTRKAEKRTVALLVDTVITDILPHLPRNKDRKKTARLLEWWRDHYGVYSLANFKADVINEGKRTLMHGRTGSTVNRYLAALGMAMKTAHKELRWISVNPMKGITRCKESTHREVAIDVTDLRKILDACKESRSRALYPIVAIAASTGARSTEIRSLTWSQVNRKQGTISLIDTKNDDRRTLYLFGEARTALEDWSKVRDLRSQYVFSNGQGSYLDVREAWKSAVAKAGFPGMRFHDLRHVAAAFLDQAGCTPAQIARVLGHRSLAMVSRYTFVREKVAKDAMEKMQKVLSDG